MNADFIRALDDLEREKGIQKDSLLEAIEAALISAYRRNFGSAQNVRVAINRDSGEIRVFALKTVVETPTDPRLEASLEEARAIDPGMDVGDVLEVEVTPRDFGRIAAQNAKQVVVQRIREAERGMVIEEYQGREGDIVTGVVNRAEGRGLVVELGRAEAVLPTSEQIPGEPYRAGDRIKAYVLEVKRGLRGPEILLSRTHPGLLRRLIEFEVPEVHDGLVELRAVAREPGVRSKVAVYGRDPRVDPVGAIIGPKGSRVNTVISELRGEKVDVIPWDPDPAQFVANALAPAQVLAVDLSGDAKTAHVTVAPTMLSLAIGREGLNARLAAKLTGVRIDIQAAEEARA
jgi:N utilization substance protein A